MFRSKQIYYYFLWLCCLLLLLVACSPAGDQPMEDQFLATITLDISPTDMLKIRHKRERALQAGMLITKSNDYVPAKLNYKGETREAEVRLKGDWLDHLRGSKWSWRVKLADTCQLDNMRKFSLQHPRVRSFLDEWVFHQLLQQEGVLTTRYTFVYLVLNGKNKGIYALEEHFDKALLHANERPEAPILKLSEDGFWQAQAIHKKTGKKLTHYMPIFESAAIEAFQKKSTLSDNYGKKSYQAAKNKLELMRMANSKASDIVDEDRMACWYALSDLVESYHSMRWHNMRFYYHPIKGVLEPLVYDAFGNQGAYRWFKKPLLGSYTEQSDTVWLGEEMMIFSMLNDSDFRDRYHYYLKKYANSDFIGAFMANIHAEVKKLETVLQYEFEDYKYNWEMLQKGSERLRKELVNYDRHPPAYERVISSFLFDSCRSELPIPDVALHVDPISTTKVKLTNWFCQPITIKAVGKKKTDQRAVENIELPPFTSQTWPPKSFILDIQPGEKYFYYTVPANDSWLRQKISAWPIADTNSITSLSDLKIDTTFMEIIGQKILVKKGHHTLSKIVVIPKLYDVFIEAGVQIDMKQQAAIIICGNAHFEGREGDRIKLYSSDHTSRGIHFMGTSAVLNIKYTDFKGQGDWWGPERWFKGGVSVLESEVLMSHCTFSYMRGEDALNIVGSKKLILNDIYFSYCEGDALDLDYCEADIEHLYFDTIGGDGLDLSGSKVTGQLLEFTAIDDKGISIGEASEVFINDIKIEQVNLGIGVKDASKATIVDLFMNNCTYGVAVFNKKPIFTAASAEIDGFLHQNVSTTYVLEKDHFLKIDTIEQVFTHDKRRLVDVFYPALNQ